MEDPKWPTDWPPRADVMRMLLEAPHIGRRKFPHAGIVLDVEHVSPDGVRERATPDHEARLAEAVKRGDLSGNVAAPTKWGARILFGLATPVAEWPAMLAATEGAAHLVYSGLRRLGLAPASGGAGFMLNPGAFDPAWRAQMIQFGTIIMIRGELYTAEELTRRPQPAA